MKRVGLWVLSKLRERPGRWVLSVLSLLYIFVLPEVFGRDDIFTFINNREKGLNEVGDFLAGFFTPLAFLWLVYGYFLQSRELGLQRQELALQREKLGEQVELLQEQGRAESARHRPYLTMRFNGRTERSVQWKVENTGGNVQNLELSTNNERIKNIKDFLPQGGSFTFTTEISDCVHSYEARFSSDRSERFCQYWEIGPGSKYKELTNGPTPLEEG